MSRGQQRYFDDADNSYLGGGAPVGLEAGTRAGAAYGMPQLQHFNNFSATHRNNNGDMHHGGSTDDADGHYGGAALASTIRYVEPSPSEASTATVSPSKNKYKFTRTVEQQQEQAATTASQRSFTTVTNVSTTARSTAASTSTKHPTLQEVQEKLRQMDMQQRLDARARLQASEAKSQRAAAAQRQKAAEAASSARYQQATDLGDYMGNMQRVSARPVPHEASVLASSHVRAASQHRGGGGAEEYSAAQYGDGGRWGQQAADGSPASAMRSQQRSRSAAAYGRTASTLSNTSAALQEDPMLPVGKRIDPSDVYYKPVQGKLQGMIHNRNNAHDVDSYSRFHPTAATAAAGGRHEGIVAGAAPVMPNNLRTASMSRHANGGGNTSSIEAYTQEVEAAQIRRYKGQAAIIHAHQVGDHRVLHYDPLMVVKPVEWRERDPSVLHGALPRSTILRQQATERKLKELSLAGKPLRSGSRSVMMGGGGGVLGRSRVTLSKAPRAASPQSRRNGSPSPRGPMGAGNMSIGNVSMMGPIPNTFGTNPTNAFNPHPMGFEDLPPRHKSANTSVSPPATPPITPSKDRSGALPQPHSPRYVLPANTSAALFASLQPTLGSSPRMVALPPAAVAANAETNANAFTVETTTTANTSANGAVNESTASDTKRLTVPSDALLSGALPGPQLSVAEAPIHPHSSTDLPFRSKRDGSSGSAAVSTAALPQNASTVGGSASAASPSVHALADPVVKQLLEKQAQQQDQIERLLKAQEALLAKQNQPQQQQHVPAQQVQPPQAQQLQRPATRFNYYQRTGAAPASAAAPQASANTAHSRPMLSQGAVYDQPIGANRGGSYAEQGLRGSSYEPSAIGGGGGETTASYVPNPKYMSPSRSLLMNDLDTSYPRAAIGGGGLRIGSEDRSPSQRLPHAWWEKHSPDAYAPPQQRERTSSPNGNIAAAFAMAAAANSVTPPGTNGQRQIYSGTIGGAHDDEVLNTALSPMSEEGRTPSPAPTPRQPQVGTAYGSSIVPAVEQPAPRSGSLVPMPVPVPIPQAVRDEAPRGASLPLQQQQQAQPRSRSSSVGAIAQLFKMGGVEAVRANSGRSSTPAEQGGRGPGGVVAGIRSDLFRPQQRSASRDGFQPPAAPMSFREAFDSGVPLPHERPAGGLSPEQQVTYYSDAVDGDDDSPAPLPSDPAALLLMQMAGRRAMATY